jgi:hypothetical protein
MLSKRSFATITQMRSGRYQVRHTAPSGARLTAGMTFAAKVDAEAWVTGKRREIDRGLWRDPADAPERVTFGVYATRWLEDRHVAGRPIKPAHATTTSRSSTTTRALLAEIGAQYPHP